MKSLQKKTQIHTQYTRTHTHAPDTHTLTKPQTCKIFLQAVKGEDTKKKEEGEDLLKV